MISVFKVSPPRHGGFTLIELLIVMLLVGLSASLIGPSLYKQYDKSRSMQQRQKVEFSLKYLAQVAFYNRKSIVVSFDGSEVSAQYKKLSNQRFVEEVTNENDDSIQGGDEDLQMEERSPLDPPLFTESFPDLFFKPLSIEIDSNGIAEVSSIFVYQNEVEQLIRFHHVIKKTVRNDAD